MDSPRRRRGHYFSRDPLAPAPLVVKVTRSIHFSDVDAMGILWHGRYAQLFEVANEALGKLCGMTYQDFYDHKLKAPIVQLHVDYFTSVPLAHEVTILGRMIWNSGARMNIEYEVYLEDQRLAAAGYTVQMFVDQDNLPLLASPALYDASKERWRAGLLGEGS